MRQERPPTTTKTLPLEPVQLIECSTASIQFFLVVGRYVLVDVFRFANAIMEETRCSLHDNQLLDGPYQKRAPFYTLL